jgi:hypothetical protein
MQFVRFRSPCPVCNYGDFYLNHEGCGEDLYLNQNAKLFCNSLEQIFFFVGNFIYYIIFLTINLTNIIFLNIISFNQKVICLIRIMMLLIFY